MAQPTIQCTHCGERIPLTGRYSECPKCGKVHDLHEIAGPSDLD